MMQNLNLTWAQDLGSVTELLSGDFFQPLGRSSSHQLWSSAMVISPLVRGLFGLSWNAPENTLRVVPNLPADWNEAHLRNVPFRESKLDLDFKRSNGRLVVTATVKGNARLCLSGPSDANGTCESPTTVVEIPLPAVELAIPAALPSPGDMTQQLKALGQKFDPRQATFEFEAWGGSEYNLPLRLNHTGITVEGARIIAGKLALTFPADGGYVRKTVTFRW
jgi:hypothetical protein